MIPVMPEPIDRVNALKTIPLLAGLPHSDLEQLAKKMLEVRHSQGSEIIKEGTSGSSVFLIISGACEVRRNNNRIRELQAGEFFGEISILDPAPRTATVRAVESSVLLVLEGYDFRTALKSSMQMSQRLISVLAERLRHMTDEFAPRMKL
jgi:CRP-like cAMP-binding protein